MSFMRLRGPVVRRAIIAIATVLALLGPLVAWSPSQAAPEPAGQAFAADEHKIEPRLQRQLERSGGEPLDFWVSFGASADTSAARSIDEWDRRGQEVVDRLKQTASKAQAQTIELLDAASTDYTAYWIVNAIRVDGGDQTLARLLAAQPAVDSLFAPVAYEQPAPVQERDSGSRLGPNAIAGVEWGVANIGADQVWDKYGVRGDGITVANIDTGVQFDHPALVATYRGNDGDGTFTNDYNWFDAAGTGSSFPTDGDGHGTHTMGTMVGDDGGANRTGVAPGATWIAANGCCPTDQALVDSAQWMLAPTKVDGSDPDPAMRPHIVNNSWGTKVPSNDPFAEDVLLAWADAGIFGVWSNGNIGPDCSTASSPGSRAITYSVGAYDENNTIARFSSRGPGQDGELKPSIAAPGVAVRSAIPGSKYALSSGTSMAAPHAAGTIALLWSADPALVGDIEGTRQLLDDAASDVADDQCGGTADDNNVYGEGRLDALAAVAGTQTGESGRAVGSVTHDQSGDPVRGATLELVAGDLRRSTRAADDGTYAVALPVGQYTATVEAFGYESASAEITVTSEETTATDITLTAVEGFVVTGTVLDQRSGRGVPGVTATIPGGRFAATTGPDGTFTISGVPGPADYTVTFDGGPCTRPLHRSLSVAGDSNLGTVRLPRRLDEPVNPHGSAYGYGCVHEPRH